MITIDSNNEFIQLSSIAPLRQQAECRSTLYHYTNIKSLEKILCDKYFKMNCINNYQNIPCETSFLSPENLKRIFVSCFTYKENCDEMWNKFTLPKEGVRLKLEYKKDSLESDQLNDEQALPFHLAIADNSRNIQVVPNQHSVQLGCTISSIIKGSKHISNSHNTNVIADTFLSDVEYGGRKPLSEITLEGKTGLNISDFSNQGAAEYHYQYETRIICCLRSTSKEILDDISYLLFPIDLSKFTLNITFNNDVADMDKTYLIESLEKSCIQATYSNRI